MTNIYKFFSKNCYKFNYYPKRVMRFIYTLLFKTKALFLFFLFVIWIYITGFKQIQKEHYPLELPPRPPATRNWRVSNVSPFAGNNMLVLYSCAPVANSSNEYFVQVLHNEEPIAMPVSTLTITRSLVLLFLIHMLWLPLRMKFPSYVSYHYWYCNIVIFVRVHLVSLSN